MASESSNPFDDEDVVLKAYAELLEDSFERATRMSDSASFMSDRKQEEDESEEDEQERKQAIANGADDFVDQVAEKFARVTFSPSRDQNISETSNWHDQDSIAETSFIADDLGDVSFFFSSESPLSPKRAHGFPVQGHLSKSFSEEVSGDDTSTGDRLQKIEMMYQCPICLELPRGRILEAQCCLQSFCEECIQSALEAIPDHSCPLCRGEPKLQPNEAIRNALTNIAMKCDNCDFTGNALQVSEHDKVCQSKPTTVVATIQPQQEHSGQPERIIPPRPPRTFAVKSSPSNQSIRTATNATAPLMRIQVTATAPERVNSSAEDNQWTCARCTLINDVAAEVCNVCLYPSPIPVSPEAVNQERASSQNTNKTTQITPPRLEDNKPSQNSSSHNFHSKSTTAVSIVKCPYCHVKLNVPKLRNPTDPFKCGNCDQEMVAPSAIISSFPTIQSGEILLKASSGTLMRKERWRRVRWSLDNFSLCFSDNKGNLLRRVHIHPFMVFMQVTSKQSSRRQGVNFYLTRLVENPRSVVAKSFSAVRQGVFRADLPIKEVCDVAIESDFTALAAFIEAVEQSIKEKRAAMATGVSLPLAAYS